MDERNNREFPDEAPARLVSDLRSLYRAEVDVPPELDAEVLLAARRRCARRSRILRPAWAAVAAAAVLLLVVGLWPNPHYARTAVLREAPAGMDFDGDGRVNVVDAYKLAWLVEGATPMGEEWDLNGDGTVDRGDADALAMAAVRLNGGGMRP